MTISTRHTNDVTINHAGVFARNRSICGQASHNAPSTRPILIIEPEAELAADGVDQLIAMIAPPTKSPSAMIPSAWRRRVFAQSSTYLPTA